MSTVVPTVNSQTLIVIFAVSVRLSVTSLTVTGPLIRKLSFFATIRQKPTQPNTLWKRKQRAAALGTAFSMRPLIKWTKIMNCQF